MITKLKTTAADLIHELFLNHIFWGRFEILWFSFRISSNIRHKMNYLQSGISQFQLGLDMPSMKGSLKNRVFFMFQHNDEKAPFLVLFCSHSLLSSGNEAQIVWMEPQLSFLDSTTHKSSSVAVSWIQVALCQQRLVRQRAWHPWVLWGKHTPSALFNN